MKESDAYADLRTAFSALAQRHGSPTEDDMSGLYGKVSDLVDAMKGNGAPPERVVLVVKRLAQETGFFEMVDGRAVDNLTEVCLNRYYGPLQS